MGLDIRSVTAKKTQLESIVYTDEKALCPKDANDADAMEFVGEEDTEGISLSLIANEVALGCAQYRLSGGKK